MRDCTCSSGTRLTGSVHSQVCPLKRCHQRLQRGGQGERGSTSDQGQDMYAPRRGCALRGRRTPDPVSCRTQLSVHPAPGYRDMPCERTSGTSCHEDETVRLAREPETGQAELDYLPQRITRLREPTESRHRGSTTPASKLTTAPCTAFSESVTHYRRRNHRMGQPGGVPVPLLYGGTGTLHQFSQL